MIGSDPAVQPCAMRAGLRLCGRLSLSPLRSLAFGTPGAAEMHPRRSERVAARLRHVAASLTPAQVAAQLEKPKELSGYRLPPPEIASIVDTPPEPILSFSPDRKLVLQLSRPPPNPPITELARPELKLAGLRIDPELFARSRMSYYTGVEYTEFTDSTVLPIRDGSNRRVTGIPPGMWINYLTWSPKSTYLAFTLRSAGGEADPQRGPLQLWVADVATGQARKLLDQPLNVVFDDYTWVDDETLVACVIPPGVDPASPPPKPRAPLGPKVEDNSEGKTSQARTYPDLLKSEHDEALFKFYTTSQLVTVSARTGESKVVGGERMYTAVSPSPDGRFLLVAFLEEPFSYAVPCGRFPKRVELWDRDGTFIREMAALPLAEDIPIAFNSCRKGPRGLDWRDDKPAEMYWAECQDGGDPAVEVSPRDVVYALEADAAAASNGSTQSPRVIASTDLRFGGISWCRGDLALLYESWWKSRRSVIWTFAPDALEAGKEVLFDRNYEDAYSDPGSPLSRKTALGTYVLALLDGERKLLMQGSGASPEGNRPFLDVLDLATKQSRRIWQSSPPYYEYTSSILSDDPEDEAPLSLDNLQMLASRESVADPPQYFIKTFSAGGAEVAERRISDFPHPYPTLRDLQKEIVRYKRPDGVDLTATLYLPPGYDKDRDGPLPCLMWAYPREFKSKDAAGQLRRSPHQFSSISSMGPLLWLARKYAVLDGPTFPIVAEGDAEPNDTYVEQLTASAVAAVEELRRRGVVDPAKIAVGGHSYGAFMAANLLAHAPDLFACGIARSGAYNRTLTPFGFQAEERTLWQAPETYTAMSPFMQADRIKKPLLLIHGADDDNTGTYPMQSERLYQALKGHGAVTRFVLLPHESHGYAARESVMHTLYEMDCWMEKWCNGVDFPAEYNQ